MAKEEIYDAIVVGSGATGGWAAKELTEKGMRVLVLEAGRKLDPEKDFNEHTWPYEVKYRGTVGSRTLFRERQAIQSKCYACNEYGRHFFVDDVDNPYTTANGKPFDWIRGRQVGGRTITWGRQVYRLSDYELKAASRTIGRAAILTQKHNGRAACHYCGHCDRGCTTSSYFSSPGSTLPAAAKTGRLTLRTNAVASHVIVDPKTGKAKGVACIDQTTRKAFEVFGKVVLLCASTIESTRLLMNSATRQHPAGLANSSGVLGQYLMDHIFQVGVGGLVPAVSNYPYNYDDGRANGIYIPKFRNVNERHPKFIRGYGMQGGVQRGLLPTTMRQIPGFGSEFKKMVREAKDPAPFWIGMWGEMLARKENRVTINKDVKDAWGIPAVHIECSHGDNEKAMASDALDSLKEMVQEAGFEMTYANPFLAAPGLCIHEVGTARMGNDRKTSVLNRFNQSWDVKNLFVTDGACFVSIGCQNPTLTMMALTARACDYVVDQFKKGNL